LTKLSIPIPGASIPDPSEVIDAAVAGENLDPKLIKHKPQLHLLSMALESDKGIKVRKPTAKEASALRFALYRARTYVQSQGLSSFDKLFITIEDNCITIAKQGRTDIELIE
jgi:hypothetical protein